METDTPNRHMLMTNSRGSKEDKWNVPLRKNDVISGLENIKRYALGFQTNHNKLYRIYIDLILILEFGLVFHRIFWL